MDALSGDVLKARLGRVSDMPGAVYIIARGLNAEHIGGAREIMTLADVMQDEISLAEEEAGLSGGKAESLS